MIKINLQTPENLARNKMVADAVNAIRSRSFAARHPELGKMINCQVCDRRHRASVVCKPVYTKDSNGEDWTTPETRKGVYGAKTFAKRRFLPHHSKKLLQLVQLTQDLFPQFQPNFAKPEDAMKYTRTEAQRILKKQRSAKAKTVRRQQQLSRRINRGLANPGNRT